jgi:hypothetical protein
MKIFFTTLFIRQNQYHKYSVLRHTLAVAYESIKAKQYRFIIPALLHDVGKPVVAFQDERDKVLNTFSFTGHEEKSFLMIQHIPFFSHKTKMLVRHHYLITGMATDLRKAGKNRDEGDDVKFMKSYQSRRDIWDSFDDDFKKELMLFKIFDDNGKGFKDVPKAVPEFLLDFHTEVNNLINK